MAVPYTRTPTSLTVVVDFRPTVIPSSHPNFVQLSELVAKPNTTEADVKPLLDIPTAITTYTGGEINVVNGRLFYRGVEVKDNLAQVILGFVKSGDPTAAEPFKKFLANCRNNPDLNLVSTIYDWCVKGNMPITPDGELIAWKIVGPDFKSIHSGKRGRLDHSIGATVTEPREECDPNRTQTCSTGIHFASLEYIEKGGYGGGLSGKNKIVAVVVNPADITAIPTDYNLSKGRCCRLRVVGEVEAPKVKTFYENTGKVYGGWSAAPAPAPTPCTPRNAAGFAVGQRWARRNGYEVTITSINGSTDYPVKAGSDVFTKNGRFNSDTSVSQFDLVRLVKDVA